MAVEEQQDELNEAPRRCRNVIASVAAVMCVLGVLELVPLPHDCLSDKAKDAGSRATLSSVKDAIAQYHLENGVLPPSLQATVDAKMLVSHKLVDCWKRFLIYQPLGPTKDKPFVLLSCGRDGVWPSDDDISAWESPKP